MQASFTVEGQEVCITLMAQEGQWGVASYVNPHFHLKKVFESVEGLKRDNHVDLFNDIVTTIISGIYGRIVELDDTARRLAESAGHSYSSSVTGNAPTTDPTSNVASALKRLLDNGDKVVETLSSLLGGLNEPQWSHLVVQSPLHEVSHKKFKDVTKKTLRRKTPGTATVVEMAISLSVEAAFLRGAMTRYNNNYGTIREAGEAVWDKDSTVNGTVTAHTYNLSAWENLTEWLMRRGEILIRNYAPPPCFSEAREEWMKRFRPRKKLPDK
jgi:hypothetical protein